MHQPFSAQDISKRSSTTEPSAMPTNPALSSSPKLAGSAANRPQPEPLQKT